jgi:hypothetical protein
MFGADNNLLTLTDATTKTARIAIPHYTNAEEPAALIHAGSSATTNTIVLGGGTSLMNAATQIDFYTAANNTTPTGTSRMTITSTGNVGIGTTTPGYKLDVSGSGVVEQRIISTDNRVSLLLSSGQVGDAIFLVMNGYPSAGDFSIRESGVANWLTIQKTTGAVKLPNNNQKLYFGANNNVFITYDSTNMVFNTSANGTGIAYFSNNVSATGYITRTSVYDKSKGSALDKIKDASQLRDINGNIIHSAFYGFVKYNVTDKSKPVITNYDCSYNETTTVPIKITVCNDIEICDEPKCIDNEFGEQICDESVCRTENQCHEEDSSKEQTKLISKTCQETTYPYTKIEEGVNIVDEIELLRQALYEQKQINANLEARLTNLEKIK